MCQCENGDSAWCFHGEDELFAFPQVGSLASIFNLKNGTPRQSGICPQSKGIIRLHKKLFNNPMHALEGIEQFKYIW